MLVKSLPRLLARGLWGLVLCALLTACTQEEVVTLSDFELYVPGRDEAIDIQLPVHLDRELPRHETEYRLETRAKLPESMRGRVLTFAIPHLYARARLIVDGREMVELDPAPEHAHRSLGCLRFRIPATLTAQSSLDVVLRVRHTWIQSGWLDTPARLSASVDGDTFTVLMQQFNHDVAWLGLATIFVAGLLGLLIFLLDRRQVAFIWFAIEAFLGNAMPMFQSGVSLQWFGVYDTTALAVGVTSGLWASVRFTHFQFNLGPPHRLLDILLVCTLLLVASGPGPFVLTDRAAYPVIGFISINVIYQIVATARLWSHPEHKVQARMLALSWGVLGVLAAADQLAWIGFGELFGGVRAGPMGVATIALLQITVLSYDYVRTLKRAEKLNLDLADRVRLLESKDLENSALNEVLRRQIAARSEQLAHAIVRLGNTRSQAAGELELGSVLESRYRIVRVLGRGGMGTVYEVSRIIDHKTFALKVLSGRGGSVEMARFAREAQLVAQLQHPNVVSIVDVDVATNGLLFIVLEFVRGKTLRDHMHRGRGERQFALDVLSQIADGLRSIHQNRIVHRDLKPDNILILENPEDGKLQVKITDFGVSAVAGAAADAALSLPAPPADPVVSDLTVPLNPAPNTDLGQPNTTTRDARASLTEAGMLIGTPRYMAPEAVEGVTPEMDVFAFGVMAFELLSGQGPFAEPQIMLRLGGRPLLSVPSLHEVAAELPGELVELVERCLSSDPKQRPSADELSIGLKSI